MNRIITALIVLDLLGCATGPMNLGPDATGASGGSAGAAGTTDFEGTGGTSEASATGACTVTSGGATEAPETAGTIVPITPEQAQTISSNSCEGMVTSLELEPEFLHFLVDVSDSMNQIVSGTTTRWALTREHLTETLDALVSNDPYGLAHPGLRLLPLHDGTPSSLATCIAASPEVAPSPTTTPADSGFRAILGTIVPANKTPLLDAYQAALADVLLNDGSRTIVLVTDGNGSLNASCTSPCAGQSSCATYDIDSAVDAEFADYQPLLTAIQSAYSDEGIVTVVVGTQGSEANRTWLSQAALQGGTAKTGCDNTGSNCHIDLSAGDSLANTLSTRLTSGLVGYDCRLSFGVAWDPARLALVVTDSDGPVWLVTQDTRSSASCSDGYRVTDGTVEFCPNTCELIRHMSVATIELYVTQSTP